MRVIGISLWSGKNSILKSHDHEWESYNKFKNPLLKISQVSPWQINCGHFFVRCVNFLRHRFCFLCLILVCLFQEYFSCAIFCKVPLFSNGIKVCLSCWVSFVLGVSDGAVFVFYSYVRNLHKECFLGLSNCNYLLFYCLVVV